MLKRNKLLVLLFILLILPIYTHSKTIELPISIYIVKNMPMKKGQVTMDSWVTKADIRSTILPEVNRIWQQARIQFRINRIETIAANNHPKKEKILKFVVNSKRDLYGKSNPKRIKKINKLIDYSITNLNEISIFLVPYLGEKSQGNAKRKRRRILIGQWTDKHLPRAEKPEPFQLVEARPFKNGSLSRTMAHEIGHILGLKHPNKKTQTEFNRLMGGKKKGYRLTPKEIKIARSQ